MQMLEESEQTTPQWQELLLPQTKVSWEDEQSGLLKAIQNS